ncbi:MAG: UDP-N-acetylmuramoyl-L-alanyl-D-glutamate--2,6-diaminopimelate ligase [Planctomycetota bacterium]|jgi:UDP-N-acetylmuramoyl-L-alanyl-D-glutamate--2,6-diaminopimelate ligase
MRLGKVLEGAGVRFCLGFRDVNVLAVTDDSRRVQSGGLFVAVRGDAADGHAFLEDALARGASVAVVEDATAIPSAWPHYVPVVVVKDGRAAASRIAYRFHRAAASRVRVVGVTGTNGKTTVTYYTRSILEAAGYPTGLMGTIRHELGSRSTPARNTTPGSMEIHELLQDMEREGCAFAVMEVSSHALDQGRVADVPFTSAVFTNLTSDHLDYHRSRRAYMKAKGRLFRSLAPDAFAVLNADDWASVAYATGCRARKVKYGRSLSADLRFTVTGSDLQGSVLRLGWRGRDLGAVRIGMPGLHNAANAAAAAAFGLGAGLKPDAVLRGIESMAGVPGRLEPVNLEAPFKVFVDYAHTEHALEAVLRGLRATHRGRILLVFGAGGDRDREKRPRMGRVAGRLADHCWVTSDNPRSEDPDAIIREIEKGIPMHAWYAVEPNRELAIFEALAFAEPGDAVLVAGKGHETTQTIGDDVREFDDKKMIARAWEALCRENPALARPGAEPPAALVA